MIRCILFTAITIKDDKNELGFGEQFCVEIEVEIDIDFQQNCGHNPHKDEYEYGSELVINEFSVNYLSLISKNPNKKLLQSFDNEEDFWEGLKKEQQEKVYSWLNKKILTKEIQDKLEEIAVDYDNTPDYYPEPEEMDDY